MAYCFYDENTVYQDGYCEKHWYEIFDGLTNHQRMHAKRDLRKARLALKAENQAKLNQQIKKEQVNV
jgi:hypothetical protein